MENNILEYKGYFSKVNYSSKDNTLHGKIEGISDLVTFECCDCNEIEREFQMAVDDYLEFCKEVGKVPEKAFKGTFNVRISPELHKRADLLAKKQGISLNQFVSDAITDHLDGHNEKTIIYYPAPSQHWNVNNPAVANYKNKGIQQIDTSGVKVAWEM